MALRAVQELQDLAYAEDLSPFRGALKREPMIELALFSDLELEDVDVGNTRFLECAFTDTVITGGSFRRTRLSEVWMRRMRILNLDFGECVWDDLTVLDSSLAALQLYATKVHRVVFQGCKLNSLNFRDAELLDVEFVNCRLQGIDFAGATLKRVRFPGCQIESMQLTGATLDSVDLSEAHDVQLTADAHSLKGAIINEGQLLTMSPAFADALGVTVRAGSEMKGDTR